MEALLTNSIFRLTFTLVLQVFLLNRLAAEEEQKAKLSLSMEECMALICKNDENFFNEKEKILFAENSYQQSHKNTLPQFSIKSDKDWGFWNSKSVEGQAVHQFNGALSLSSYLPVLGNLDLQFREAALCNNEITFSNVKFEPQLYISTNQYLVSSPFSTQNQWYNFEKKEKQLLMESERIELSLLENQLLIKAADFFINLKILENRIKNQNLNIQYLHLKKTEMDLKQKVANVSFEELWNLEKDILNAEKNKWEFDEKIKSLQNTIANLMAVPVDTIDWDFSWKLMTLPHGGMKKDLQQNPLLRKVRNEKQLRQLAHLQSLKRFSPNLEFSLKRSLINSINWEGQINLEIPLSAQGKRGLSIKNYNEEIHLLSDHAESLQKRFNMQIKNIENDQKYLDNKRIFLENQADTLKKLYSENQSLVQVDNQMYLYIKEIAIELSRVEFQIIELEGTQLKNELLRRDLNGDSLYDLFVNYYLNDKLLVK